MSFFKKLKEKVTSPKATVFLKLAKNTYVLGEKVEGTLSVTSEEEFDATEIRAELRCEEKKKTMRYETETVTLPGGRVVTRPVVKEEWVTETIFSENPQGSGSIHLYPGQKADYPFSTSIPAGGQACYSSTDRSVTWDIKGVIGVKGRPDVTSSAASLQVVAAPIGPITPIAPAAPVMIPCEYCGTLMEQTSTTCPYCGGRRKA